MKPQKPINILQSTSYALPYIPVVMLFAPMMTVIQGVYAKYYGIELANLASIILLSRLLDAISDPVVGYYSDRYHAKHGTRKPFIVGGTLLVLICAYFLFIPFGEVTPFYAGFWLIAFYSAFTLFEIPHMTWPSDIARNSSDKTKLYSYRSAASYCGLILFYSVPLLPIFKSSEITPETLKVTFIIAAILGLLFIIPAIRVVPNGSASLSTNYMERTFSLISLKYIFKEIVTNKPFMLFLFAFVFSGFSIGMWYGLIYIYVDAYLHMGDQFAKMFLIAFFVGLCATPFWYKFILIVGKKNAWMFATAIFICSFIYTGMLEPENTSFIQLLAVKVIQTCGLACVLIVAPAMLSEIIDYSFWKTNAERKSIYFSVKVFFEKANFAAGAALALAIAGWYGFDMAASEHTKESIVGLKMAIVWAPTLLGSISLIFIALSPIDERRHRIISSCLKNRAVRVGAMVSTTRKISLDLKDIKAKKMLRSQAAQTSEI